MKMTKQHYLFCEAYTGDNVQAMKEAGFEGSDQELDKKAKQFLSLHTIVEAIKQRNLYRNSTAKIIATREERQAFWTALMRNEDPHYIPEVNDKGVSKPKENLPLPMRLKASELLGKSETDFVERLDMNHNISITDVIKESYTIGNDNLDAIEAQYEILQAHKQQQQQEKSVMVDESNDSDESLRDNPYQSNLGDYL